jgi:hypothetical protein
MRKSRYSSGEKDDARRPGPQPPKRKPGNKNGGTNKPSNGNNTTTTNGDKQDVAETKASKILDAAIGLTDKLSDKGLNFTPSATPVRSGASTGAKTIDPWRAFKSENGQVNDND